VKVRKAVVLAAGLGTRLRPFTCATPKPLMPVWGVPMLARVVDTLRGWGVDDIVVNCHHLHGQVEDWCAANGCRAVREPEILGTGGVLNPLRDWIGGEDFYLVNGDIVLEGVDSLPFGTDGLPPGVIGECLVTEDGPRTIEVEPDSGFVTCWKSPDPGWSGTFTYCGAARLSAAMLDYVEPSGFSTIVQAYERATMEGRFVRAVAPAGLRWADAGTVESYIDLNRDGEENAFAAFPQLEALGFADGVEFLGARGSDRAFFRSGNAIAVIYDDERRPENARYAGHAKWLAERGVPVPAVLADRPDVKATSFEFAGATDLRTRVEKAGPKAIESYVPVVEALAAFNALDASAVELEPPFDAALWKWERDLFAEHCLGTRFAMEMPKAVEAELEGVAELLEKEPKALVHRDFQSTNVLWKNGAFKIIDFQGMRPGPAAYDLASLLYDPYVRLTEGERRALAALYGKKSGRPEIAKVLPSAAVQRLVQCLGAYGRLASVGQPQFGKWVVPALENLLAAADEAGLDAVGALAEDLIAREQERSGGHGHHHDGGCSCGGHGHHRDGACECGGHHHRHDGCGCHGDGEGK